MSTPEELHHDPATQVWRLLEDEATVMIATPDSATPMRPMTVHPDAEERAIWFFTRAGGEFAEAVGEGGTSHIAFMSRDGRTQFSLIGRLEPSRSALHIDRYWNAVVASWFEKGRDDPLVLLMRFTPQHGRLWVANGGVLGIGWELAKASLTGERPHLGESVEIVFSSPD